MAFTANILSVVCSKEGPPRGDHGHPRTPPSYAPDVTGSFVIEGCRTSSTATKMSIKSKRMGSAAPLFSLLTCTFPQQNHQLHRLSLELICYMHVLYLCCNRNSKTNTSALAPHNIYKVMWLQISSSFKTVCIFLEKVFLRQNELTY